MWDHFSFFALQSLIDFLKQLVDFNLKKKSVNLMLLKRLVLVYFKKVNKSDVLKQLVLLYFTLKK